MKAKHHNVTEKSITVECIASNTSFKKRSSANMAEERE